MCTCCKTYPCVTKHYQLEYRCWLPCVMLRTTAIWHHSHNLQFVGTCLLLLGTESMLIMAIKYSMGRRVVLWSFVGGFVGYRSFFGLQKSFQVPPCCGCACFRHSAGLGGSYQIGKAYLAILRTIQHHCCPPQGLSCRQLQHNTSEERVVYQVHAKIA